MAEERRFESSHGRHIASDALRGLAVGVRGVLEAKRMAREAKSDREKRIADHYVRLKRMDLQERRLAISEGAAAKEMEQVRLDSLQAEQEHKNEWHKQLAAAYDRLESLYRERNRAAAPKEIERIDNEVAMEARAVVRLGKNLGYSYPHIEQGLKEREDATIEFEEKSGRIDALDISDEHKAALHTALGNEFFGLSTGTQTTVDEILGQLKAIEALDETPEMNREQNSLLQDSYLNKEFGVDVSAAEEAEDVVFDRAPKETDFKRTGADGVEYNLHAEVAYMIDIDGWSREEIKAQLQKDYPALSDEQIETVLNDPEFEYPEDVE